MSYTALLASHFPTKIIVFPIRHTPLSLIEVFRVTRYTATFNQDAENRSLISAYP
ncbi:hypothetical protein QWZ16_13910 [Vibrio ostreicida]|uniref:Uncharacterized protein n=1 Tax=Vibrio ostreicida TaxID=526588 RepID=A0ABT8BUE5_9VIBR|nr:hypothetical protein [Vibrio ostreicida]MDN3610796.1 hypothetical protein [Vibrio ostreicida]